MGVLNSTGYQVQTFAEYKALFQAAFISAFGAGIDLSETSPQGNLVNAFSEWAENGDKVGLDVFQSMNIKTAEGVSLDFIALLRRVVRKAGTKSVIDCAFTSSATPYSLSTGERFTLTNNPDIEFELAAGVTISSTPQTVQLIAVNPGEVSAEVGDKLTSVSFIQQLQDIEITVFTNGTDTETDDELRARLETTNGENARATVESIYFALLDIDDVQKVNVLENATGSVDGLGLPAHSIEALVLGGLDADVAEAIFNKNPAGTVTFGSTTVAVTDIMLNSHDISFTRPTQKTVEVRVTVQKKEFQDAVDTTFFDTMKQEIKDYVDALRIGEDVSYTTVYGIFAKFNSFDINLLEMRLDAGAWVSTDLSIDTREYADLLDVSDITITVV